MIVSGQQQEIDQMKVELRWLTANEFRAFSVRSGRRR
jgi:hypothetical protein